MTGAEAALGAARLGDQVVHGFGLMGMVAGAILGAVVAFAFFAGTIATGGLLAVAVVGGCIAAGGLAGGAIARGIMKAADLPGPTTGLLAAAGPSRVSVNSRQALRAGMDFTASCSGAPMNHPPVPVSLVIAEGSETVRINGKPMARQSMRMRCGAKVKAGSDNVTVGGPTDTVVLVIDTETIFESGLKVLGVLSLFAGAAGLSIAGASVAAKLSFLGITVGQMTVGEAALQALHRWGESLGPGYGDIMVGAAGFALLPLQNTKPPVKGPINTPTAKPPTSAVPTYQTPYKPLTRAQRSEYRSKVENRTITRDEYNHLQWDRRFNNRRRNGVERFWSQERRALESGEPGTRNWTPEQRDAILSGKRPKHNGETIEGHHRYNALDHPQLANDPSIIYPATRSEHLHRWHGGSWRNDTHGKPNNPNFPEEF